MKVVSRENTNVTFQPMVNQTKQTRLGANWAKYMTQNVDTKWATTKIIHQMET